MIYVFLCETCGGTRDEIRKVKDRNKPVKCELCDVLMIRQMGGHNVSPDIHPYYDDNLQIGIKSRQHRKQVMKEAGVYERYGKGWQ